MTQVTLHIDSKKKLAAIKTILEAMGIAYDTKDAVKEINEKEEALLRRAETDLAEGNLQAFKSHREILGR